MKEFLTKSLILVFGLGVAMSFTACHSEGSDAQEQSADVSVKHSISGTILKADGTALTGATVKINNSTVTVSGNAFSKKGLADGNYVIEIACANYKSITETVALQVKNIDGKQAAQNLEKVYYLSENVTTTGKGISGTAQTSDDITLATTQHKDADGNNANTTNEEISVHAETPMVTGDPTDPTSEIGDVDKQIKDQIAQLEAAGKSTDGVTGVSDFKITLTNITSLEDAKAVAVANHVATSRMTRATTAMPDGNELLAGVAVNAGPYAVTLPAGKPFVVKVKIPDEVKGAITLFRTFKGDSWTKIDMDDPSAAADIESIDKNTTSGVIIIKLKTVQTQSFGFGVIVNETSADPQYEDIYATPLESGSAARTVPSMAYQAKSGVVMTQTTQSALTDFLRKIVIRKYGTRIVKEAKLVEKSYIFDPVYTMHANGTLYLQGWQTVQVTNFSVKNSTASFTATEYGDIFVAPYEVWTETEEPVVHGGGSN